MSTSQTTFGPFEPVGSDKISIAILSYVCARNRQRQFDLVVREFKKSGLSQKELADRIGSTADVISRVLARPRNWEADTFARLMFGISGAMPVYQADYPFRRQVVESIDFQNKPQKSQEDAKPDLTELGLVVGSKKEQHPKDGLDWASQFRAGRAA